MSSLRCSRDNKSFFLLDRLWQRGIFSCRALTEKCSLTSRCCGDDQCYYANGYAFLRVNRHAVLIFLKKHTLDFALFYNSSAMKWPSGPFYCHALTLIPAWISNHMARKVWDEITYPFPNFNSCTVEVWEWISHFIPHFIMIVITYPCWD